MPHKDKKALATYRHSRRVIRRELDAKYREKHRARRYADANEKHWRFTMREVARIPRELLEQFTIVHQGEMLNPVFLVISEDGQRRYESLLEPLPVW